MIIPIIIDKDTYDSMSIDLCVVDSMFPKWYWYWVGLFSIFCTVYLFSIILYKEWTQEMVQLVSYGYVNSWDLMFFPCIYIFCHMPFAIGQPTKWWTQILAALATQIGCIAIYGSMLYFVHR